MEYSLQIDLAICLNTEYVWTRRTKKAIRYLYLMVFYYFSGCRDLNLEPLWLCNLTRSVV